MIPGFHLWERLHQTDGDLGAAACQFCILFLQFFYAGLLLFGGCFNPFPKFRRSLQLLLKFAGRCSQHLFLFLLELQRIHNAFVYILPYLVGYFPKFGSNLFHCIKPLVQFQYAGCSYIQIHKQHDRKYYRDHNPQGYGNKRKRLVYQRMDHFDNRHASHTPDQ